MRTDDFWHIGSVNHVQPIHDQRLHLLLASGVRITDIWSDGMVNTANLLPVGYLSCIYLTHLVSSQVLDRILVTMNTKASMASGAVSSSTPKDSAVAFSFLEISRLAMIMSHLPSIRFV